jgi:hypothetical protein
MSPVSQLIHAQRKGIALSPPGPVVGWLGAADHSLPLQRIKIVSFCTSKLGDTDHFSKFKSEDTVLLNVYSFCPIFKNM